MNREPPSVISRFARAERRADFRPGRRAPHHAAIWALLCGTVPVWADPPSSAVQAAKPSGEALPAAKADAPAKLRPKYLDLRYDEAFRYLEGDPTTFERDKFDRVKNIRIGDDLRLSIGGEFRFRAEAETNLDFGAAARTQDTFQLYRYLMHFDLHYRDVSRLFFQLGMFHDEDRDLPDRPSDENHLALQQAFWDLKPLGGRSPLILRVGRQELSYGKQRFVSPLEWANTRRRFDAVKMIWKQDDWQFDLFWSRPIPVQRNKFDDWDNQFDFYGAYFSYLGIPRHGVEFFAFAVDDRGERVNPNGNAGDVRRYTLGTRFFGKTGAWDYEAELAGQWGSWASDRVEAYAATLEAGYTWKEVRWSPRLGAGLDWATGDRNAQDGSVETFDQLFPLGHGFLGYIDLVGRQNIRAATVDLNVSPIPQKLTAQVAAHAFWLDSEQDALYNAAGRPTRRDPAGGSGREVGYETDFTIVWNATIHHTVLIGYSHFWDNSFIAETGESEDPDLFYLQYRYRF